MAAYGEAMINIALSIILASRYGLIGVTIGTNIAVLFRMVFYAFYLSKNILNRKFSLFIKRVITNLTTFAFIVLLGKLISNYFHIKNYFDWALYAAIVGIFAVATVILMMTIFYRNDIQPIIKKIFIPKNEVKRPHLKVRDGKVFEMSINIS